MKHELDDVLNETTDDAAFNDKVRSVEKLSEKMKVVLAKREDMSKRLKIVIESTDISDVDFLITMSDTVEIYDELAKCASDAAQLMREIVAAIRIQNGPAQ